MIENLTTEQKNILSHSDITGPWANDPSIYGSATERADADCKRIIKDIIKKGSLDINPRPHYADGTPAHTYSINHVVQTYDLSRGDFPLLSLRPIAVKSAIGEMLWIYQDQSNDLDLLKEKYGVTWWDDWDLGDRTIGQCYGATVKRYDLINKVIKSINDDPDGRRHIINLWQEADFNEPHGLKPCAFMSQYNVRHDKHNDYLDAILYMRSSDYLTAGAINQVQYIALQYMIAQQTHCVPGRFTVILTNCQIYDRHIDNAFEMLRRKSVVANPYLALNRKDNFYDYTIDDFNIIDYPRERIKVQNPQLKFELGI